MHESDKKRFHVYKGEKDGHSLVAMLDPSYQGYQYKGQLPWFLWIRVEMHYVDDDGLPKSGEAMILNQLEDRFEEKLQGMTDASFVGRVTWNGERIFYYYLKDAELANSALKGMLEKPEREFEYRMEKDEQWVKVNEIFGLNNKR